MEKEILFKRKAFEKLKKWKEEYADSYAILLEGARRVGKSTIASEFAKAYYKSFILIDFSNTSETIMKLFDDISDLKRFFLRLQVATGITLYEHDSVIIFDEVQLQPKARQAIKHLVKDGRYHYIETGSLISIKKNVDKILIPSEEMKLEVTPMDYEEFCWATGINYSLLEDLYKTKSPIGQAINRSLMRDFRTYMAVGGMPQAVEAYINGKSFQQIDLVKRGIIDLYKSDFAKIDSSGRIAKIYESIPSRLALGRKINLTTILKKRKTKKDEELLSNLIDSKTVLPCYNVTQPNISLSLTCDTEDCKLYMSDIGLFVTILFNDKSLVSENIYEKLLSDKLDSNLGYLYENVVAQLINASGRKLYYHCWKENEKTHPYEIDFLLTCGSKIVPVEVKSSNVNNHQSINEFYKKYHQEIKRRILFSQKDLSKENDLELKPLYFVPFVLKEME